MKVALAQISPKLGDVASNLALHLEQIEAAAAAGAELVVFPEMSLCGYRVRDLHADVAIRANASDPTFSTMLRASQQHNIDIVFGFVEMDDRARFYIACAYLANGKTTHVHRKVYLPTYGMFDDSRYFAPGSQVRAFDTKFGRIGIMICEDFWHLSTPQLLWLDGADYLIFTSASPGRGIATEGKLGSSLWVEHVCQTYASSFTDFIIHCNRVGFEDGIHFSGGSAVFDPDGEVVGQAPYHDPALTIVELDRAQFRRTRSRLPLLRDERPALTHRELQRILEKKEHTTED